MRQELTRTRGKRDRGEGDASQSGATVDRRDSEVAISRLESRRLQSGLAIACRRVEIQSRVEPSLTRPATFVTRRTTRSPCAQVAQQRLGDRSLPVTRFTSSSRRVALAVAVDVLAQPVEQRGELAAGEHARRGRRGPCAPARRTGRRRGCRACRSGSSRSRRRTSGCPAGSRGASSGGVRPRYFFIRSFHARGHVGGVQVAA